ncbi:dienelactone hydrolase family protein [Marinobacter alexandrii]|uniref:dienelactone hydrolase family protein n=1 Tax=Marinobacter alexandrii TaxID=2570351 RepID=UPI0032988600
MNPESSSPERQVSVNGNNQQIDQRIFDLYDEYCHGEMDRREFLRRASVITVAGVSALSMAQALLPRYADAAIVSFNDDRIKAQYVEYPSPGGNSGEMRGYLVQPAGEGPWPAVLVVHENRGLNPYVEDVARRCALEGFIALAPDGLYPAGGYPGNDDEGRTLQRGLDQAKLKLDMLNSAQYLKNLDESTGALGATGFCWGGGVVNFLAVNMGEDIRAVVPYYGASVPAEDVSSISAAVMVQSAEQDPRINALWPDFEAALKANDVEYQRFLYPDTQHGFHNNSTPRYNEAAAELSWQRTLAFFQERLTS